MPPQLSWLSGHQHLKVLVTRDTVRVTHIKKACGSGGDVEKDDKHDM